ALAAGGDRDRLVRPRGTNDLGQYSGLARDLAPVDAHVVRAARDGGAHLRLAWLAHRDGKIRGRRPVRRDGRALDIAGSPEARPHGLAAPVEVRGDGRRALAVVRRLDGDALRIEHVALRRD